MNNESVSKNETSLIQQQQQESDKDMNSSTPGLYFVYLNLEILYYFFVFIIYRNDFWWWRTNNKSNS